MTTCAIYARQSTDNAEGIDRQLERCRDLADKRGWTVTAEYADNAQSASKARASGSAWSKLLASTTQLVIAVDLDRLLRSQRDLLALMDAGKMVVTVDGEIDLSSADGEFRATMLAGIARFEVRRKAERQSRAAEYRRNSGLPVAGKRRYGFMGADPAVGRKGNVEEHPVEGPSVRAMFEAVSKGVPTYKVAKQYGLNVVTLYDMLRNRAYVGEIPHLGQWYPAHESVARIVPQDLFDATQALLSDPSRKTSPGMQIKHLASGLAVCGVCGTKMHSRGLNYICPANLSHPTIRRVLLDSAIETAVIDALSDSEARLDANAGSTSLKAIDSATEALRARERDILSALDDGTSMASLRPHLAKVAVQIKELEAKRLEVLSASLQARLTADIAQSLTSESELNFKLAVLGRFTELPFEQKRELIKGLLSVKVHNGRGQDRIDIAQLSL